MNTSDFAAKLCSPRAARRVALLLGLFCLAPSAHSAPEKEYDDFFENARKPWIITPGLNGGINKLGAGYDGYEDMGKFGGDLYFRPPLPDVEEPDWRNKFIVRLSADYFPLQVPQGVYGLTEDMYSVSGSILYKFMDFRTPESSQFVPFVGLGVGAFLDRIELDTPASGKVTGTHRYFGAVGSAGFFLPELFSGTRLVPEVRYHAVRTPGNFSAVNISYQVALVFWRTPE